MSDGEAMSGAHDCGGDAAAYVLGALEPAEADAFRRHLEDCAVCRDEVEALEGVVKALPMAAPQMPAPRELRRSVIRAVREDAARAGREARRRRWSAAPRPGWPSWPAWHGPRVAAGALAAAVVVAAGVIAGIEAGTGGDTGRLIQARVVGISGTAQLRVRDGHGELILRRLTPPPRGHVYEVWLKAPNAAPVPASVLFSVNSSGAADVGLPRSLKGVSQVMVTPEPDGGSPAPTHTPVIVAPV